MITVITAILEVLAHIIMYAAKAIVLAAKVGAKTAQVAGKATVEASKVAVKVGKAGVKAGTKAAKTGAKVAKKGAKVAKQGAKTVKKGADIARKGAKVAKKGADTAIKAGRTVKDTAENSARLAMSATQNTLDFVEATDEEKIKKLIRGGGKTALTVAKKATILAAKTLWNFLKVVTKVIALMYSTLVTGIAFTLILFIGAVSIIVILMANSGVGLIPGVSFDGGNQTADSGYIQPSYPTDPSSPDIPVNPSSGDCIACLQTMANWYLANVTTYQAGPLDRYGNKTRKNYSCPLMPYKPSVGDDCSAFAAAYASLVSGVKIPDYGSGTWVKPDTANLLAAGWTPLYTNDIGGISGLQPGDILVCNKDNCTYAQSKGHHCEVYIASGQSFGWGKVQTKYPSSTATLVNKLVLNKITGTNDYIAISSGGHDYVLVWRYTGGN